MNTPKVDGKKKCYDEKIFKSSEINFLNYFLFFSGQKLKMEILARIKYFLSFSGQNQGIAELRCRDPWTAKSVRIFE